MSIADRARVKGIPLTVKTRDLKVTAASSRSPCERRLRTSACGDLEIEDLKRERRAAPHDPPLYTPVYPTPPSTVRAHESRTS